MIKIKTIFSDQFRVPSQYTTIDPLTLCGQVRSYIKNTSL
uniref:Uncharacterized protein n=1 Tax=Haemophilus influenzae TaxID=727 RepID=A0A5B8RLA0_HAEIF|nr:hypothetical protein [Haemophilus influenzae]QEA08881.1 hypothetical protein [Haemophilus influenzae]